MIIVAAFVLLVFLYSLVSNGLKRTVLTTRMAFTATGILLFLVLPVLGELEPDIKAFLLIAEVGLVLTLIFDATRINLQVRKGNEEFRLSLLIIAMLPAFLPGVITSPIIFPQLSLC